METQRPMLEYDISPLSSIHERFLCLFYHHAAQRRQIKVPECELEPFARSATVKPASVDIETLEARKSLPSQPFTVTLPRTFKADELSLNIQLSQADFDGLSRTESTP